MLNKKAIIMSEFFIDKGWVEEHERAWCVYVIEKWAILLIFYIFLFCWMLISGTILEALCFIYSFSVFRRRTGGYHARRPATCIVISILIVAIVTIYLGPLLISCPKWLILIVSSVICMLGLMAKPIYPAQANLTYDDAAANLHKKNRFIILVQLPLQLLALIIGFPLVTTYMSIGTAFALIMLLPEHYLKLRIKGGNEQ